MTHTLATLVVPKQFYNYVRKQLKDAGYEHAVLKQGDEEMLDMSGIALTFKGKTLPKTKLEKKYAQTNPRPFTPNDT